MKGHEIAGGCSIKGRAQQFRALSNTYNKLLLLHSRALGQPVMIRYLAVMIRPKTELYIHTVKSPQCAQIIHYSLL